MVKKAFIYAKGHQALRIFITKKYTTMEIVIKEKYTKTAIFLLRQALKNKDQFVTGRPLSVISYCLDADDKITVVTFETENGIEEAYSKDCLYSAIEASTTKHIMPRVSVAEVDEILKRELL